MGDLLSAGLAAASTAVLPAQEVILTSASDVTPLPKRWIQAKDSEQISQEQLPLLDADVLIWQVPSAGQRAAIRRDPVYRTLEVAREGRAIFFVGLDDPVYGVLSFSTVLSLPYALDRLVPKLTAAVDRGRTTKAAAGR